MSMFLLLLRSFKNGKMVQVFKFIGNHATSTLPEELSECTCVFAMSHRTTHVSPIRARVMHVRGIPEQSETTI